MKAILQDKDSAVGQVLYMALELSHKTWKLGLSNGEKQRVKSIEAGDWAALRCAVSTAKVKLGCEPGCRVISCYEAGRDGFWVHRALTGEGVENHVVDSASIEVKRRRRQVKTDRVDVGSLLRLLIRFVNGERQALTSIRVPSVAEEDQRRLNRERKRLQKERSALVVRSKSLLVAHGIRLESMRQLPALLPEATAAVVGYALPPELTAELRRSYERFELVDAQLRELEREQQARVQAGETPAMKQVQQLMTLKGVSWQSSWPLVMEFFSWRDFANGKQVGACAGLTPTPFTSGDSEREQGISKAGNKRIRTLMVELAWQWLRHQPDSQLSRWYRERFGHGGKRWRRIGIVALARKLLLALWRYLETGQLPAGAVLKEA